MDKNSSPESIDKVLYNQYKLLEELELLKDNLKCKMEHLRPNEQEIKVLAPLVSGFAHEIRNPLNAITALLEALFQDIEKTEILEQYQTYINTQVDRINRLMKDLIELGKPENQANHIEIDLVFLCAATVDFWNKAPTAGSSSVNFINRSDGAELMIHGDYIRIQQVLVNLFENSSLHSHYGEEISLIVEKDEKMVHLYVIDQGVGVTEEIKSRAFEPFFTTRKSGTGLGLGIARHIIETHKGHLYLSNNIESPGCTASIGIPLKRDLS
ncbi:Signal transduction histidine kinase [Chitinispirillum alkaliphilum]|nr:Signal transduction histidine kinase [Chitinispirillum alkaliphilum]